MNIEDLMEVIGEVDDKWIDNYNKKKTTAVYIGLLTKVAAVIVGILVLSFAIIKFNPAFAEKVKSFFGGYIGKDNESINLTETPDMEKKVEKDVLTDENEHLRFEILEHRSARRRCRWRLIRRIRQKIPSDSCLDIYIPPHL